MKLIKASTQILTRLDGEEILKQIEKAARSCYKSEGKIIVGKRAPNGELIDVDAISARPLIEKLIKLGHEAMLEFGGMVTVRFTVDRGVSHELVRHRMASFAQESTRYCNYNKDEHIKFIIPNWLSIAEGIYEFDSENSLALMGGAYHWVQAMANTEQAYDELSKVHSWTPQQARSVLPNSLATEINVSANIREWRHIFKLRTAKVAHPQMLEVMRPLLTKFKAEIPVLFDDINY